MIRVMNVISDTNIGGAGRVLLNYLRYACAIFPWRRPGPRCLRWTASPTAPGTGGTWEF